MKYMLDTNICIALIRQKPQSVIQHLVACTPGDIAISSITVAEETLNITLMVSSGKQRTIFIEQVNKTSN